MKSYNFDELMKKAADVTMPTKGRRSAYSFGIVNSGENGKRLTFSKALAKDLDLDETVQLIPLLDEELLLVGTQLPNQMPMEGKLSGHDGRKICYDSAIVSGITEAFGLTFRKHTSQSFSDIKIETHAGSPLALIHIIDQYANETDDSVQNPAE